MVGDLEDVDAWFGARDRTAGQERRVHLLLGVAHQQEPPRAEPDVEHD
jgi:hypothetical protein